ncbi:MAG: hypothetical protein KGO96_10975 [Elusimicrobia bacterium]|nr:hypothetical protein [Elusimicrobiota bacterium]MDE2236984.1 hypothetical protein [Elusimicrobiota bacterium]MDE2426415.1 hypothetical protein [Elusimicrobiota bacterium]
MAPTIKSVRVEPFTAVLKRPFVTALGRKTVSPNVGVILTLSDGAAGYGEASASLALKHLSQGALAKALHGAAAWARGRNASCPGLLIEEIWRRLEGANPAAAAFEAALLSACARSRGLPLRALFGGGIGGGGLELESDITISACGPKETMEAARRSAAEGFCIFKVKVGGRLQDDLERVRLVRRARPGARIRLDGNQGLTPTGALRLVEACLRDGPVELLEQPLAKGQWRPLPALSRRCPVPIALDESVSSPEDAVRAAELGACGAINVKAAKSGLLRSLSIIAVARAAGLKLMIGCMAETAAGLSASVALALGTQAFDFIDLDSDHLLLSTRPARDWSRRGPKIAAR